MKSLARRLLRRTGFDLVRLPPEPSEPPSLFPDDTTPEERRTFEAVQDRTMTSVERIVALVRAVDYLERNAIAGDIVECGVWRGGSMMAIAHALLERGAASRTLHLFDTYDGMSEPTAVDRTPSGESATDILDATPPRTGTWCYASIEDVRANLASTGYPESQLRFVVGKVEDTIPERAPASIALLRLDTDWYESTKHELEHLYPRLVPGGILVIDDYGHWEGARMAVDEYLGRLETPNFLNRIDYTGRLLVKPLA